MKPRSETFWDDVSVFGERVIGCEYVVRPSAYAIWCNERGALAIAIGPGGAFLPGGGIASGETPAQTVVREAREECGLIIVASSEVGRAVEIVHSPAEQRYFEKRSIFLRAIVQGVAGMPLEADHQLTWLPPAVAITRMAHRSHAWAVQQWVNSSV